MTSPARWEIIYEDLRAQIQRGELIPGAAVPTEQALSERYSYSRQTVRAALSRLQQDGLITRGAGSQGRTVRRRDPIRFNVSRFELGVYKDDPAQGKDQWESDAQSEGWNTRQVVTEVGEMAAPDDVARLLDVPPGTTVVRRRRLRYVSRLDTPEMVAMVADTWTPTDIARQTIDGKAPLLERSNITMRGGIYHALGYRQVQFEDEIQARMPTPEESRLLHLDGGIPVGQHARVGVDAGGRRVRVLISIWAGDRQRLIYHLDVPHDARETDEQIQEAAL